MNFRLADSWLHDVLVEVLEQGVDGYARADVGAGVKVNVEFVSANPTGPLHAGHGRGAAYGDSLARVLERVGYDVSRENYLNDRGVQMQQFVESLAARQRGEQPPDDGYAGEYIADWAAEIPEGADLCEWGEARAVEDHRETLARMNVHFDHWFSERSMVDSGAIEQTLADLRERGVVYDDGGAVWLRSTDYGDDKDRVLVKSDGEFTYLLPDIAYHRDKFARGFDLLVDVWGADHHGYVPRMKAAMQALGHDPAELAFPIIQLVNLVQGRRAGPVLEAHRQLRRARRRARTTSAPTPPASPTCCSRSTRPRPSTSTSSPARPTTTRSSTSRWPTPGSSRSSGSRPSAASSGRRWPRSTCRCSSTSASSTCCGRSPSCPTPSSPPPPTRRRTASPPGSASSPAPSTASTTTATSWVRASAPSSPRPGCSWSRPPSVGLAIGLDLLGVSAPEPDVSRP